MNRKRIFQFILLSLSLIGFVFIILNILPDKNREKKREVSLSNECKTLLPIFYMFRKYGLEMESFHLEKKTPFIRIFGYLNNEYKDIKKLEESVKFLKNEYILKEINEPEKDIIAKLTGFLLKYIIDEDVNTYIYGDNITFQRRISKLTKMLCIIGNIFEINRTFSCAYLSDTNNQGIEYNLELSRILVDLQKYDPSLISVLMPNELFFIFSEESHLRKTGVKMETKDKECYSLPTLFIKNENKKYYYVTSEFLAYKVSQNDVIYCNKKFKKYEWYDSNGLINYFDVNQKLVPLVIKFTKVPSFQEN